MDRWLGNITSIIFFNFLTNKYSIIFSMMIEVRNIFYAVPFLDDLLTPWLFLWLIIIRFNILWYYFIKYYWISPTRFHTNVWTVENGKPLCRFFPVSSKRILSFNCAWMLIQIEATSGTIVSWKIIKCILGCNRNIICEQLHYGQSKRFIRGTWRWRSIVMKKRIWFDRVCIPTDGNSYVSAGFVLCLRPLKVLRYKCGSFL